MKKDENILIFPQSAEVGLDCVEAVEADQFRTYNAADGVLLPGESLVYYDYIEPVRCS